MTLLSCQHCHFIRVFRLLLFGILCVGPSRVSRAESLKITSNPSGATVELNGVTMGTTPFEKVFAGGYFHRTRTVFGARLEHPMVARISLAGYATREIALTEGPMVWIDLHGRHHGEYWLFKSEHFHADLESIDSTFTGRFLLAYRHSPLRFRWSCR